MTKKRQCFICNGTGSQCMSCGEASDVCGCENENGDNPEDFDDCEDCFGTGIASADIEESDLDPKDVSAWKERMTEKP